MTTESFIRPCRNVSLSLRKVSPLQKRLADKRLMRVLPWVSFLSPWRFVLKDIGRILRRIVCTL